jgi:hypothetical protein
MYEFLEPNEVTSNQKGAEGQAVLRKALGKMEDQAKKDQDPVKAKFLSDLKARVITPSDEEVERDVIYGRP